MFGKKVNNVRVVPVTLKIVFIFTIFILISNLSSNYINLVFNRSELFSLMNQLLTKDLKDFYSYCSNQYEIYQFDKNIDGSLQSMEDKGLYELKNKKAVFLAVHPDGKLFFQSSKLKKVPDFKDKTVLSKMNVNLKKKKDEDNIYFSFNGEEYFGIYKYNPKWDAYIIRAEELNEFYAPSRAIFRNVSIIIIAITLLVLVIGNFILRYILRYLNTITTAIMKMVKSQQLSLIDMSSATNDDVTFLGTAFNSLSSSVDNLISIFRKFANQDIVSKAYNERQVKLEGTKRELAILFSDIKSFTFITETLGTDIIKLLNLHYDRAIREIHKYDGVIGSIIGDALLAVYGALEGSGQNKSYQAVRSAYKLHEVTEDLRTHMRKIKEEIEQANGHLTKEEQQAFKAVLLEIGVGIDGGEVFYGTLGSYVRMTNTVIGDNVNAASRLEGLTRVYRVPVICSEYIKKDIETNVSSHGIQFIEIDKVLVKGKTTGIKIYWPVLEANLTPQLQKNLAAFQSGLALYYEGDWRAARAKFNQCKLVVADVFKERTRRTRPKSWKGIWEMTTK